MKVHPRGARRQAGGQAAALLAVSPRPGQSPGSWPARLGEIVCLSTIEVLARPRWRTSRSPRDRSVASLPRVRFRRSYRSSEHVCFFYSPTRAFEGDSRTVFSEVISTESFFCEKRDTVNWKWNFICAFDNLGTNTRGGTNPICCILNVYLV